MKQPSAPIASQRVAPTPDLLQQILRDGARKMRAQALQAEVAECIDAHADQLDEDGRRLVLRNGTCPERTIQTALGSIPVARPRVDDRRLDEDGGRIHFTSKILPPYSVARRRSRN